MSRIPILCYHNIALPPPEAQHRMLYVSPSQLERQLRTLHGLGIRGVSMSEGMRQRARERPDKTVVLTFDDGYADNLDVLPLLRRYGFSATCYVVSDFLGKSNGWDEGIRETRPLMGFEQLRSWLAAGMEIGSHSCSHARLDELEPAAALRELMQSRMELQGLFGIAVDHFCYPYGRVNSVIADLVQRAGYQSAVTTQPGVADSTDDPYTLPRVLVHGTDSLLRFAVRVVRSYRDSKPRRSFVARCS